MRQGADVRTWTIIPVKRLSEAKSSLSEKLNPEQRRELILCMLGDVLDALREVSLKTLVVSPDDEVLKFAGEHRAAGLKELGLELNEALRLAVHHAVENGADSVLILPGDLPLLRPNDLKEILSLAISPKAVVIAPSEEMGTNALFLRPPNLIELKLGGESFPLHEAESLRAAVKPLVYRSPTIARDIDKEKDLVSIKTHGQLTRTYRFFQKIGFSNKGT